MLLREKRSSRDVRFTVLSSPGSNLTDAESDFEITEPPDWAVTENERSIG